MGEPWWGSVFSKAVTEGAFVRAEAGVAVLQSSPRQGRVGLHQPRPPHHHPGPLRGNYSSTKEQKE